MHRHAVALAAALVALHLVACSSSSGSSDGVADGATDVALDTASPPVDSPAADVPVVETSGDGAVKDTWDNYAQGFFAKYCVECHADAKRDYRTLADVTRDSALIRCGVAPTKLSGCGSFPPPSQFPIDDDAGTNPKPTDDERRRLVAWIDAP